MSGVIENGKRLAVAFGAYEGEAGICERDGAREVAMFADLRALKDVTRGTIDGAEYKVLSVGRSVYVPRMTVLTVTAVTNTA